MTPSPETPDTAAVDMTEPVAVSSPSSEPSTGRHHDLGETTDPEEVSSTTTPPSAATVNEDHNKSMASSSFAAASVSPTEPPSPTNTDEMEEMETAKPKEAAAASSGGGKGSFKYLRCLVLAVLICSILIVVFVLFSPQIRQAVAEARHARNPTMAPSFSMAPSSMPSDVPSMLPSDSPSGLPSGMPSDMPSDMPSLAPSEMPSVEPSQAPSSVPSLAPTPWGVDPHPVPDSPPRGYFNYDRDGPYGPDRWSRVDTSRHPLREFRPDGWGPFRGLFGSDITNNQCGGPERRQSPKDLKGTIVCDAHHEIRTWCGDYKLTDDKFEVQILPHKLSLVMNRRPCINVESNSCQQGEPPMADYPRYSSFQTSYSDLITYDVKVPSEHTIDGKRYDAEIQMLHVHPADGRISSIGIVVEATSNGHNSDFQAILNQFQIVYDRHENTCRRRQRNLRFSNDTDKTLDNRDDVSAPFVRQMNVGGFDPYSDKLFPTMFFYRYDGSITEPPCKDLTWWVLTDPMTISFEQLKQVKRILFTHVDEDSCNPTSVHNEDQSVARPIFPLGSDREIQDCSAGSFQSDVDKGRLPGRRCRAN